MLDSTRVISAHLPLEHSLFHAHVAYHSRRQKFCCRRTACVEQFTGYAIRQITGYGQFRQHLKTQLFRLYTEHHYRDKNREKN